MKIAIHILLTPPWVLLGLLGLAQGCIGFALYCFRPTPDGLGSWLFHNLIHERVAARFGHHGGIPTPLDVGSWDGYSEHSAYRSPARAFASEVGR